MSEPKISWPAFRFYQRLSNQSLGINPIVTEISVRAKIEGKTPPRNGYYSIGPDSQFGDTLLQIKPGERVGLEFRMPPELVFKKPYGLKMFMDAFANDQFKLTGNANLSFIPIGLTYGLRNHTYVITIIDTETNGGNVMIAIPYQIVDF